MYYSNLFLEYRVMCSLELLDLRIKLNITTLTADHLYGFIEGTYEECENNLRQLTALEDSIIKDTNLFNDNGNCMLPQWMQIKN